MCLLFDRGFLGVWCNRYGTSKVCMPLIRITRRLILTFLFVCEVGYFLHELTILPLSCWRLSRFTVYCRSCQNNKQERLLLIVMVDGAPFCPCDAINDAIMPCRGAACRVPPRFYSRDGKSSRPLKAFKRTR